MYFWALLFDNRIFWSDNWLWFNQLIEFLMNQQLLLSRLLPNDILYSLLFLKLQNCLCIGFWLWKLTLFSNWDSPTWNRIINCPSVFTLIKFFNILKSNNLLLFLLEYHLSLLLLPFQLLLCFYFLPWFMICNQIINFLLHMILVIFFIFILWRFRRFISFSCFIIHRVCFCSKSPLS